MYLNVAKIEETRSESELKTEKAQFLLKIVNTIFKKALVIVIIGDHMEQLVCYLAKLDVYTIILDNG